MRTLYSISIYAYRMAIQASSLFNWKAKLWISGRKNTFSELKSKVSKFPKGSIVWFHCASLGEFEQGRPLIEKYKLRDPDAIILLTFFSPSGYEIRKNYNGADIICYLPLDSPRNAKRFLDIVQPKATFFVKYEFWFNYLNELKQRKIPTYLISGIFRPSQHFFKFYGSWFRENLNCFTTFFLQDSPSEELLHSIGFKNCIVAGDTRFDRVSETVKNVRSFPLIEKFKGTSEILIAGSTWPEDEKLIAEFFKNPGNQNSKIIIAPHEIHEEHLRSIEAAFNPLWRGAGVCLRYSQANDENIKQAQALIIDNIGMLSSLYQYGSIAFIGGGFGKGIHNILEASAFGLPVIFGPEYEKFSEAKELVKLGGAFPVKDIHELKKVNALLEDSQVMRSASHIAMYYVQGKVGATDKILSAIDK